MTTSFAYDSLNWRTQVISAYGAAGLQATTNIGRDIETVIDDRLSLRF